MSKILKENLKARSIYIQEALTFQLSHNHVLRIREFSKAKKPLKKLFSRQKISNLTKIT